MNKTATLMLGLLCAVFALRAGGAGPAVTSDMALRAGQLMQQALEGNRAYDLVTSLTTAVGPRLAGTPAEARARQWAVAELTAMGFANVRVETFEVPLWERGVESAAIVGPFPQPLLITALGGSAATGPEGVEGEVVSFASLEALAAVPPDSLRGRIAFVDEPMARSRDGSGYAAAVGKRREAAYVAGEKGALAVLIRSVGTSTHRFAHTGQMRRVAEAGAAGVPAAALAAPDADQLRRALVRAGSVVVRIVLTPRQSGSTPSGNVVAEIVGRERPQEIVLAGAHLDSWDLGTGAVDDGAGVAIVLAAARLLLTQLPEPPRRTVRIVLFGAEEIGLLGAQAYAQTHAGALDRHIVASESDFGTGDVWRFDTRAQNAFLPALAQIGAVLERLDIAPGNNEAYGGPDMKYLHEAGVPVVGLLQDGRDYFDLHHTADDTLDKIAPGALDQNVAAWAAFLYLAAETEAYFR